MGAQQSTLVAAKLQQYTIEELLENHEFLVSLEAETPRLSYKSQANLQSLAASSRKTLKVTSRLQTAKLKPLLRLREGDIKLSPTIDTFLLDSTGDWTRLFWSDIDAPAFKATESKVSALLWAYNHMFSLEKKKPLDRIRWRFYTMFFYDLHCLVNEKINLTSKAVNSIISAIDTTGDHFDTINANIRSWISRGHRYRNISRTLGSSGCLFLLPESISDYLWEESLPLNGPTHVEAMNRLRSLGIMDKTIELGMNDLAEEIEDGLLDAFKQNLVAENIVGVRAVRYPSEVSPYLQQDSPSQLEVLDQYQGQEYVSTPAAPISGVNMFYDSVLTTNEPVPWSSDNPFDIYGATSAAQMIDMKGVTVPYHALYSMSEHF